MRREGRRHNGRDQLCDRYFITRCRDNLRVVTATQVLIHQSTKSYWDARYFFFLSLFQPLLSLSLFGTLTLRSDPIRALHATERKANVSPIDIAAGISLVPYIYIYFCCLCCCTGAGWVMQLFSKSSLLARAVQREHLLHHRPFLVGRFMSRRWVHVFIRRRTSSGFFPPFPFTFIRWYNQYNLVPHTALI